MSVLECANACRIARAAAGSSSISSTHCDARLWSIRTPPVCIQAAMRDGDRAVADIEELREFATAAPADVPAILRGILGVLLGTPSVVPSGRYRTNGIGYP